jgi:hypothetical protein
VAVIALGCGGSSEETRVVLAAGDIADCESTGDEQTTALLDEEAGTVLTLGDHAYDKGTPKEFRECYDTSWGRHRRRTRPIPGKHDYNVVRAPGYEGYFGDRASPSGDELYYSFDLGTWHVVALDSERDTRAAGRQAAWLRRDLAENPADCVLAFWHRPRWTRGRHDDHDEVADFWRILYDAHADLVLAGHDHNYQRYPRLDPDGRVDPARGLRSFVVGTGGRELHQLRPDSRRHASNDSAWGVLRLELRPERYEWKFLPVSGAGYSDSGSSSCNRR